jgi:hypothetical protein
VAETAGSSIIGRRGVRAEKRKQNSDFVEQCRAPSPLCISAYSRPHLAQSIVHSTSIKTLRRLCLLKGFVEQCAGRSNGVPVNGKEGEHGDPVRCRGVGLRRSAAALKPPAFRGRLLHNHAPCARPACSLVVLIL